MKWISIKEQMPPSNKKLLFCSKNNSYYFLGYYTVGNEIEYDAYSDDFYCEENCQLCEEGKEHYLKKGFYEEIECTKCDYHYDEHNEPTHWCELKKPE